MARWKQKKKQATEEKNNETSSQFLIIDVSFKNLKRKSRNVLNAYILSIFNNIYDNNYNSSALQRRKRYFLSISIKRVNHTSAIKTKHQQVRLRRKKKINSNFIRHTLQPNVTAQSWAGLDDSPSKEKHISRLLPTTIFSPNLLTSPPKGHCTCTGVGENFPSSIVLQRHETPEAIFDLPAKWNRFEVMAWIIRAWSHVEGVGLIAGLFAG